MCNYLNKREVALHDIKIENVQYAISNFVHRYQRYYRKNLSGVWKCRLLRRRNNALGLQLVDRKYEVVRGINVEPESPVIWLSFRQENVDVILTYQLCYRKKDLLVRVLLVLGMALTFGMMSYYIFSTPLSWRTLPIFLFLIGILVTGIVWVVQEHRHNILIIRVFEELLQKNFDVCFNRH